MNIAATQWLLGIRPELSGLRLAPCLPSDWKGYTAIRRFRGCEVKIEVIGNGSRVSSTLLNGMALESNLIPAEALIGKSCVQVVVQLSNDP